MPIVMGKNYSLSETNHPWDESLYNKDKKKIILVNQFQKMLDLGPVFIAECEYEKT